MSTQRTDYVVHGIKFGNTEDVIPDDNGKSYEKYEPIMSNDHSEDFDPTKISLIYDGMNGEFIVVGYILAKGQEDNGGMQMTNVGKVNSQKLLNELKKKHPDLHEKYLAAGEDADIGVWAFTLWH